MAIGGNLRASVLAGLPVRRTLITVYALSRRARRDRRHPGDRTTPSQRPVLHRAAARAVRNHRSGGRRHPAYGRRVRILGTVAGVVLMQVLQTTLVAHNLPDSVSQMVEAVIIVFAVYIQRTSSRSSS